MDIIKALEDFNYYHSVTDGSLEEWKARDFPILRLRSSL